MDKLLNPLSDTDLNKPIYSRFSAKIYRGDCLTVLKSMPSASIDTVLTDPPYNNGCKYASYNDLRPQTEYADWCGQWFAECRRIANRVIVFPGPWNLRLWLELGKPGGIGCWYKPGTSAIHVSANAFQFVEWEPFLVYGGTRMGGSNVLRAPVGRKRGVITGEHPCPKPLHLMTEIVRKIKGDSILDPFMGSGTVGIAVLAAGKKFVGIELDNGYCKSAVFRIDRLLSRLDGQCQK